jgi:hypothetical protein
VFVVLELVRIACLLLQPVELVLHHQAALLLDPLAIPARLMILLPILALLVLVLLVLVRIHREGLVLPVLRMGL